MTSLDIYAKRPAFFPPKDVEPLRPRPVDLDKFDAELGTAQKQINEWKDATRSEEIAALVLALTYGEMVETVGQITEVAEGKLKDIDLAPILFSWAHGLSRRAK